MTGKIVKGERITFTYDRKAASQNAHIAFLDAMHQPEHIMFVNVARVKFDEPLGYKVPYVVTPRGIFQGLDGIKTYLKMLSETQLAPLERRIKELTKQERTQKATPWRPS